MGENEPLVVRWRKAFLSNRGPEEPVAIALLLYLSCKMQADGSRCFPSIRTIARELRCNEKTVKRYVAALRDSWLDVTPRRTNENGGPTKGGRVNQYFPRFPRMVGAQNPHAKATSDVDAVRPSAGDAALVGANNPQSADTDAIVGALSPAVGALSPDGGGPESATGGPVPPDLAVTGSYLASTGADRFASQNGRTDNSLTIDAPSDWPVPDDLRDGRQLYSALNDTERAFAFEAAGASDVPLSALLRHNDASPLPERFYRELAYRVTRRRNGWRT